MKSSPIILASLMALAVAACGGGADPGSDQRKGGGGAPFGFELAAAATGDAASAPVAELSPDEVARALATDSIRLIDIRTEAEVANGGTIPGAEHIPMDRIDGSVLEKGDGREVVLYCRSGARSLATATRLAAETGKTVTHMPGGILAWRERVKRAAACDKGDAKDC